MDVVAWVIAAVAVVAVIALVSFAPRIKRHNRARQIAGGGALGGIGAGFDSVWRPSAEEAHAAWEAQIELPAPAPTPGDKGGIDDGAIVIVTP